MEGAAAISEGPVNSPSRRRSRSPDRIRALHGAEAPDGGEAVREIQRELPAGAVQKGARAGREVGVSVGEPRHDELPAAIDAPRASGNLARRSKRHDGIARHHHVVVLERAPVHRQHGRVDQSERGSCQASRSGGMTSRRETHESQREHAHARAYDVDAPRISGRHNGCRKESPTTTSGALLM